MVICVQNKSRDPQRTPMQWSNGLNAGFSESKNGTWLDIGPNFNTINVEVCFANSHNNELVLAFLS